MTWLIQKSLVQCKIEWQNFFSMWSSTWSSKINIKFIKHWAFYWAFYWACQQTFHQAFHQAFHWASIFNNILNSFKMSYFSVLQCSVCHSTRSHEDFIRDESKKLLLRICQRFYCYIDFSLICFAAADFFIKSCIFM